TAGPSEKCVARCGGEYDDMRMIPASFARVRQQCTDHLCMCFLITFQEVRLMSKTCNQLIQLRHLIRRATTPSYGARLVGDRGLPLVLLIGMREQVEGHPCRAVPIRGAGRRLQQWAHIADHGHLLVSPQVMQTLETGMERQLAPKTRDGNGQESGLWYCESRVLPYRSIRRVVIIGDKHVAAVIAAEQKDAHQRLVISRLPQRLEQANTLKSQDCCANRGEGSTDKRSPCECHVTLLLPLDLILGRRRDEIQSGLRAQTPLVGGNTGNRLADDVPHCP